MALTGLLAGGLHRAQDEALTRSAVILVLLVKVKSQDNRDGGDGSQDPQNKVLLAVVVNMADGATIEGVIGL